MTIKTVVIGEETITIDHVEDVAHDPLATPETTTIYLVSGRSVLLEDSQSSVFWSWWLSLSDYKLF